MKTIFKITFALILFPVCLWSQTFISSNSSWNYLDDGSNQGTAWRANGFDDSSWQSGNAELGYGDGGEATVVSYGNDANNKYITTYFRKSFNVTNPGSIAGLDLDILVDDGAVVYLNGVELLRQNMPTGSINYLTLAPTFVGGAAEQAFTAYNGLPSTALVAGTNVIAVEIHQQSGTSSDIGFNLSLAAGSPPGQPNVIRGPYLQIGTSSSVVIKWRTDNPSDSKITYGTSPTNLNQSVSDNSSTTQHELTLTGLSPFTTYYYTIGTTTGPIEGGNSDYSFTTSPVAGTNQPVRAWVLGDCGTADGNAAAVRNAYENYVNNNNLHTDMILMLGDNAYNSGTDSEYQAAVFDMYTSMLRKHVLWSCPGNHDYGNINSYLDIFTQPTNGEAGGIGSGTERYYSYDYGNIHFISLDSHGSPRNVGGTQYNWLQNDLNNTTADWIVAYWHHPAYTNGSHNSDNESYLIQMRENFLPLLESHGVDLVLSGHSHSYERTFLLNGHYGYSNSLTGSMILDNGDGNPSGNGAYDKANSGDGAVYITAGSSGKISGVSSFPMMYTWLNQLGSVVIETQNDEMRVRFLRSNGSFTDDFTITKDISNQAPVASNDSDSSFQGVPVTVDVLSNDTDPNGSLNASSVSIVSGPSKGTIDYINPTTGEITYTPGPGTTGNDVFTYEVCDDGIPSPVLCSQATVTINILVNTAPVANTDNANTNENTGVNIDVANNDSDAENNLDLSSVQITSNPTNGAITNISNTGVVSYMPNANYTGTDAFSYTIDDDLGLTSNQAQVNINVYANVAPIAVDDMANTIENTAVFIPVFGNDTDVNNDLDPNNSNTTGLLQPLHGVVSFIPGTGYLYTPDSGFKGIDIFEYEVCDMSNPTPLCDVARVDVTVDCAVVPNDNIITGTVYEDLNQNQSYDRENGQNGVELLLYSDENNDGQLDGGDVLLGSDVTDSDGNYSFAPNPVFTTNGSTNVFVNNDIDDAWQKNNGDMENDKSNHEMGKNDTWEGLRFRNVNIPANAVITDARLVFRASADEDDNPSSINIYGELSTSPAVYNEVDYGISNRARGTAVPWSFGDWTKNQYYNSPNVAAALQDIIDLGGWAAGNNLAFVIEGTSGERRKFYSHDGNNPVELVVDYEVPGQAEYRYLVVANESSLPANANLTTDNIETALFTEQGQVDCHNNFGFYTGPPNVPPTVSMTSPASGTYTTPQTFDLVANASDTDGTVSQVEFFVDGVSAGIGVESPAGVFTLAGQVFDMNGTYNITAVATDNSNDSTTSNAVTITIDIPNDPPTVSITDPLDGTTYTSSQSITVSADVTDNDFGQGGVINSVEFFANGNSIGVDNSAPYSVSLLLDQDDSIDLTAAATDGLGEIGTSNIVHIDVDLPNVNPTVSITSPAHNTSYTSAQTVSITASASDSDGTVSSVDFYVDGVFLSSDNSAPYTASYLLDTEGSVDLTATAIDNEGGMTTSSITTITLLTTPTTVSFNIIDSDDDAWEKNNGDMKLDENDHQLSKEGYIGLRYQNINIPSDATITEAYIEFTASNGDDKNPSSVMAYGELDSNPGAFLSSDDDISDRILTAASESWTFAPEWIEDSVYPSPDLTSVVSELITQGGWNAGNAMVFLFESTGDERRKAYTFDDEPSLSPKLVITYLGGTATIAPLVLTSPSLPVLRDADPVPSNKLILSPKETDKELTDLLLFPNPTTGELNVSFTSTLDQKAELNVMSFDGRRVLQRDMQVHIGSNKLVLTMDNLVSGSYIVMIKYGAQHISNTVILH